MDYKERMDRVIDFIGKHFDEELSLDELCRIACFSKYHFHRLFTAYTGLPLGQYLRGLRLKRAAHQFILFIKRKRLLILRCQQVLKPMSHLQEPLNQFVVKAPANLGERRTGKASKTHRNLYILKVKKL